ncbi:MAG: UPF0280 family protein [Defluviicoccus sp.]
MSGAAQATLLADGRRLYLQHGPIDLIIAADGARAEVEAAYRQAWAAFTPVLADLVDELSLLRRPVEAEAIAVEGPVAQRMVDACRPHAALFITPMAAVAGAVADHVLAAMLEGRHLKRAYVNNGGDIALFLAPGTCFEIGIVPSLAAPRIAAVATIAAASPVRGVATSGQGGRSLSCGIADAVTVLARSGAQADAAATLIANAVDIDSRVIERQPANTVVEDTDLGALPVVTAVGALTAAEVESALDAGRAVASDMRERGLIAAAYLHLRGRQRLVGAPLPVLRQEQRGQAA